MPSCSAFGCSNNTGKGYRLFSFPTDRKLRSIWECKVSRTNWKASMNSRLCEEHFQSSDFELKRQDGKKKLRWNSTPSKFIHRTPVKRRKLPKIRGKVVEHTAELCSNHDHIYCKKTNGAATSSSVGDPSENSKSCSQLHKVSPLSVSTTPCRAASYKAAVCVKIGAPLEIRQLPHPNKLNSREILISTHAVGVNFADILTCKGQYQDRRKTPFTPGGEIAGKVLDVGNEVSKVKIGDRVVALDFIKSGGASEIIVTTDEAVFPVPEHLSLVDAAGTVVSYSTAMMALSRKAKLKKGETVLVTAAAGATGLAAVDIARNCFDCEVIAVCGGADKCKFLKEKGASHAIDYNVEKIRERVKEITKGKGVHVAMDQVGGDTLLECIKSLGFEGRALTVGYAAGIIPDIPANQLLLKSSSLIGVFWGSYATADHAAFLESVEQVFQAINEKKIHPFVGQTFSLEQINEAFQYILDRKSVGKVVIKIRDE